MTLPQLKSNCPGCGYPSLQIKDTQQLAVHTTPNGVPKLTWANTILSMLHFILSSPIPSRDKCSMQSLTSTIDMFLPLSCWTAHRAPHSKPLQHSEVIIFFPGAIYILIFIKASSFLASHTIMSWKLNNLFSLVAHQSYIYRGTFYMFLKVDSFTSISHQPTYPQSITVFFG